jgi:hypothetical protein
MRILWSYLRPAVLGDARLPPRVGDRRERREQAERGHREGGGCGRGGGGRTRHQALPRSGRRRQALNAALYGTPQTRHRAFLLAYHKRLRVPPVFPDPTHTPVGQAIFSYKRKELVRIARAEDWETAIEVLGADPLIAERYRVQGLSWQALSREGLRPMVTVEEALSDLRPVLLDPDDATVAECAGAADRLPA